MIMGLALIAVDSQGCLVGIGIRQVGIPLMLAGRAPGGVRLRMVLKHGVDIYSIIYLGCVAILTVHVMGSQSAASRFRVNLSSQLDICPLR